MPIKILWVSSWIGILGVGSTHLNDGKQWMLSDVGGFQLKSNRQHFLTTG